MIRGTTLVDRNDCGPLWTLLTVSVRPVGTPQVSFGSDDVGFSPVPGSLKSSVLLTLPGSLL